MKITKNLNEKSLRNVFVLAIIAVSVYIGFEPLIALVPDGVSKAVISSSFGAIFVIILTMYLLNKQTEIEQESKRSEKLFDERIKLFQVILEVTEEMLKDGYISSKEIKRLPFPYIRLCMLCDEKPIEAFRTIFDKLNAIYASSDNEEVKINDAEEKELIKMLFTFSVECRINLQVSSSRLDEKLLTSSAETVSSTKKKRDYTKHKFFGKNLTKNRYIHAIIKNFATQNSHLTKAEFEKIIPSKLPWHPKPWVTFEEAKLIAERDRPRHYIKDDEIIQLADAIICVSNGQDKDGIPKWLELFKRHNIQID
jgi:hypothetical protein